MKDYYAVLSLSRNVTTEKIRARFLELARERHPDKYPAESKGEAEAEFQEITEAFNALVDPERRREHDLDLARPGESARKSTDAESARVYIQRGVEAYRAGSFSLAAESFELAAEAEPANPKVWHNLALCYGRQRPQLGRAVAAAKKACELEPMNPTYLFLVGRLCVEVGNPSEAEKHVREAIEWGADKEAAAEILQRVDEIRSGRG